jgi:hypothetical protein
VALTPAAGPWSEYGIVRPTRTQVMITFFTVLLPFFSYIIGFVGAVGFWPATVYYPIEVWIRLYSPSRRHVFWLQVGPGLRPAGSTAWYDRAAPQAHGGGLRREPGPSWGATPALHIPHVVQPCPALVLPARPAHPSP